jgi:protein-tyrosine phosphatase
MHVITDELAVGNAQDAANPHWLMSVILNVAAENRICPPEGRTYTWIPFTEFAAADPLQLDEAVSWLEQHEKGNRLLICCRAGIGRSVSVAIAYLCLVKGMPYGKALSMVVAGRPGALPLPELEETIRFLKDLRRKRVEGFNA